ncbi:hypothetical protein Tco_0252322 [Tanacetum coccineum]
MALPPRDQRHQYLRYEGLQYTDMDIADFETRLARIYRREMHRVQVFDFGGLPDLIAKGLSTKMLMEHKDAQGFGEAVLDLDTDGALYERLIPDKGDLSDYWVEISSDRDFLRGAPSYTYIRDLVRRLCHRLISYNISGRGQALEKVIATDLFYLLSMDRGQLTSLLPHHFGLVSDNGLRGLSVVTRELPLIDMGELVKLKICIELGDNWAWVAPGPKRQQDAAVGALKAAEDAPAINEGAQAVPAPMQAPQPPPPPPVAGRTIP